MDCEHARDVADRLLRRPGNSPRRGPNSKVKQIVSPDQAQYLEETLMPSEARLAGIPISVSSMTQ
jgi:hypothetical protein